MMVVAAPIGAMSQDDVLHLNARVTDLAGVLNSNEKALLESRLKNFEDSTSTQVVAVIVPDLQDGSIEEYSMRIFEENKIGQADQNNGVLVLVAMQERSIRIEVGYGLEGVLTDALSIQIINREMRPFFQQGDFFEGLRRGLNAIMLATAGEYSAEDTPVSARNILPIVFIVLVVLFRMFFRGSRRGVFPVGGWAYLGGWHSSGRSLGGGSFGGWSGGGGLGGGGGATGRW